MAKSRRVKSSRKSIYLILILVLVGILSYSYYRSQLTPTDIFVIEESVVQYGDTTVTGTLTKDAVVGDPGNYILALPDGRPIILDAQGLDGFLGATVHVTGNLAPATDSLSSMTMTVTTITIAETQ